MGTHLKEFGHLGIRPIEAPVRKRDQMEDSYIKRVGQSLKPFRTNH